MTKEGSTVYSEGGHVHVPQEWCLPGPFTLAVVPKCALCFLSLLHRLFLLTVFLGIQVLALDLSSNTWDDCSPNPHPK